MNQGYLTSDAVVQEDEGYVRTAQAIWSFLNVIADYYSAVSGVMSKAKMALSSIESEIYYANEDEWKIGETRYEVGTVGEGRKATDTFIQALVQSNQRFYEIHENLATKATNLLERLKVTLPNLSDEERKILEEKLTFERPDMEFLQTYHTVNLSRYCYERNIKKIEELTMDVVLRMNKHYQNTAEKFYFLEDYLARLFYSFPLKAEVTENNI
ncbi:unnamed protein product [Calicophoron daubneyi]|uniref:Uncharacterized protein n=1 Tax=Calicophoron daubneyi TaxID=300641 RepID=A0AAV2SXJ9_CALDB